MKKAIVSVEFPAVDLARPDLVEIPPLGGLDFIIVDGVVVKGVYVEHAERIAVGRNLNVEHEVRMRTNDGLRFIIRPKDFIFLNTDDRRLKLEVK